MGKAGDGKTTAINAFFNIIKGIKIEDNYRFILVSEQSKIKGQADPQTEGVHLYYVKDNNNIPLIIIDSQGYGDAHGARYDEKLNEALNFAFSNLISHINVACFVSNSNYSRLDILAKNIFSYITSLFSEDIIENYIILCTFANRDTLNEGPFFIEKIKDDASFLRINDRIDEKWWYAFDSKSILDNETDRLTKYSFSQLTEFYEDKVKKLKSKSIKNCLKLNKI